MSCRASRLATILGLVAGLLSGVATAQPLNGLSRPQQMDLIISAQNARACAHDYSNASAWIWTADVGNRTGVFFWITGAKPRHIHTVWLRLAGPSPLSGAGATPAAPVRGIDTIMRHAGTTSAAGANAFYTNRRGSALVWIPLDFRLSAGVYPFSRYRGSFADVDIGNAPFTFRVISHCTDHVQHGLSPGAHEPTFQISLP